MRRPARGRPWKRRLDLSAWLTKLGVSHVASVVGGSQDLWPNTVAEQTSMKALWEAQCTHINGFGHIVGRDAVAGDVDWAGAGYNWNSLDNLMSWMQSARTSIHEPIYVILYSAPFWMMGITPDGTFPAGWDSKPVLPDYNDEWGSMCAYIFGTRYANVPNLHALVWNEFKGYWNTTLNRADYEGYLTMYEAVRSAVKAVRADVKFGGPYPPFRGWPNPNGGSGGRPKLTTLALEQALDAGATQSSIGGTDSGGEWWIDARYLDAMLYFLDQVSEVEIVVWDERLDPERHGAFTDSVLWVDERVRRRWPNGKPMLIAEWYYNEKTEGGGILANYQSGLAALRAAGKDLSVMFWNANEDGDTDITIRTDGTTTAIGDAVAAYTADRRAAVD